MNHPPYTCQECGSHVFIVVHRYYTVTRDLKILKCRCGKGPDGVAGQRTDVRVEEYVEWGPLDAEHRWEYRACNLEEVGTERVEAYTYCPACVRNADESQWETLDRFSDTEQHEFYVFCEVCEREIEFGWSQEAGEPPKIWPVESADFKPEGCTPDPRYEESWRQRGWDRGTGSLLAGTKSSPIAANPPGGIPPQRPHG